MYHWYTLTFTLPKDLFIEFINGEHAILYFTKTIYEMTFSLTGGAYFQSECSYSLGKEPSHTQHDGE